MLSHREWLPDGARVGLVPAIVVGMFLCSLYLGCKRESHPVIDCRVSFCGGAEGVSGEVCLNDASLINRLVWQPMMDAKRDPEPADYAVVGELTIRLPDGSRENLVLFSPWGHYKRDGEYFIADFSELQTTCEEALATAQRRMDAVRTPGGKAKRGSTPKGSVGDAGS